MICHVEKLRESLYDVILFERMINGQRSNNSGEPAA